VADEGLAAFAHDLPMIGLLDDDPAARLGVLMPLLLQLLDVDEGGRAALARLPLRANQLEGLLGRLALLTRLEPLLLLALLDRLLPRQKRLLALPLRLALRLTLLALLDGLDLLTRDDSLLALWVRLSLLALLGRLAALAREHLTLLDMRLALRLPLLALLDRLDLLTGDNSLLTGLVRLPLLALLGRLAALAREHLTLLEMLLALLAGLPLLAGLSGLSSLSRWPLLALARRPLALLPLRLALLPLNRLVLPGLYLLTLGRLSRLRAGVLRILSALGRRVLRKDHGAFGSGELRGACRCEESLRQGGRGYCGDREQGISSIRLDA
jgi:hypothetical protein